MFDENVAFFENPIEIGKLNFETPVVYLFNSEDEDEDVEPSEGIAFGKQIICLCCGAVIPLDEVVFLAYNVDSVWPTIEVFG